MAKGGGHGKGQKMPYRVVRSFDGGAPMRSSHWTLGAAEADLITGLRTANLRELVIDAHLEDAITGELVVKPMKCVVCGEKWATEGGATRGTSAPSTCGDCHGMDETSEPIIARRAFYSGKMFCLRCPVIGSGPELPITSSDLPDGGICSTCSVDLLIVEPAAEAGEQPLEVHIAGTKGAGKTSQAAVMEIARHMAEVERPARSSDDAKRIAAFEAHVAPYLRKNKLPDAGPSALLTALDRLNIPRAVWTDGTVAAEAHGILWTMQAEPHSVTGAPCGVWSVWGPESCRGHFGAEGAARFIRDRRVP